MKYTQLLIFSQTLSRHRELNDRLVHLRIHFAPPLTPHTVLDGALHAVPDGIPHVVPTYGGPHVVPYGAAPVPTMGVHPDLFLPFDSHYTCYTFEHLLAQPG